MRWYSIKSLYKKTNEEFIYEERIVIFSGVDHDWAIKKAEVEAKRYQDESDNIVFLEVLDSFEQYSEDLDINLDKLEGYEVYSQVIECKIDIQLFMRSHYGD